MIRLNAEKKSLVRALAALWMVALPAVCSGGETVSKSKLDSEKALPVCLKVLMTAKSFDDAERGESPHMSDTYIAYRDAAGMIPSFKPAWLERILKDGSPAGRLYAAVLLKQSKPAAIGNKAFEKLLSDNSTVDYKSGCKVSRTTVSEVARSFIEKGTYLRFRMAIFCTAPLPIRSDK